MKKGVKGFPQICFFAIPLITIVAFFVLRLFLPILVFLFNLYFLLAFRFCILPSVSIDAGLDADLKLLPGGIDVDAAAAFTVAGLPFTPAQLGDLLQGNVAADAGVTLTNDQKNDLKKYANAPLLSLGERARTIGAASDSDADSYGVQPTLGLHYEAQVEWPA